MLRMAHPIAIRNVSTMMRYVCAPCTFEYINELEIFISASDNLECLDLIPRLSHTYTTKLKVSKSSVDV